MFQVELITFDLATWCYAIWKRPNGTWRTASSHGLGNMEGLHNRHAGLRDLLAVQAVTTSYVGGRKPRDVSHWLKCAVVSFSRISFKT